MNGVDGPEAVDTVVIGGGQAGLAVGYHLTRKQIPFVILDENERIGDVWRNRWESLRLFTPARYSGLPGMSFPGSPRSYPSRDEVATYFEAYASRFDLPVRTGIKVDRIAPDRDAWSVHSGERRLRAENVVVATGAYHHPRVPDFAPGLDRSIFQVHSSEYRDPSRLRDGGVLVVGAGNSGAEIAIEVSRSHPTWLSGRDPGQEPTRAGSVPDRLLTPLIWQVATRASVDGRIGRKLRDSFLDPPRGIPLGRVRRKDIRAAGIERVPRATGAEDGFPVLENGRVMEVSNVIWCTGYTPRFHWIDADVFAESGFPVHQRGIVESAPGLYFMGLLFLHTLSSALLGGVGRDAEHIVSHIAERRRLQESTGTTRNR